MRTVRFFAHAKGFMHCVVPFLEEHVSFPVAECVNECFVEDALQHARLPRLQPATVFGCRFGAGVGSHGSSFGSPARHRGVYES